jgi:putative transposase
MPDESPEPRSRDIDWPHAPPHRLETDGAYFVTASTYLKRRLFHDSARLALLHDRLLAYARRHRWRLEAWAVFSNHYHIVAQSEGAREDLGIMAARLHQKTASELNAMDGATGRKVWQNYRETRLTFERSYLHG